MFSLQQNHRTRGWNRFCPEVVGDGKVAQTMCTHVSKYKNDKIKCLEFFAKILAKEKFSLSCDLVNCWYSFQSYLAIPDKKPTLKENQPEEN
jgi:hypothetical protein